MEDIRHPQEQQALNDMLGNQCIALILEQINKTYAAATAVARITQRNFLVTKQSYPRVYGLYMRAASRLGVRRTIPLYIEHEYKIQSETIGSDEECIILISSACVDKLDDRQLMALLGYELGHIKFGHVKYRNIFKLMDDIGYYLPNVAAAAIDVAKYLFLTWRQFADFTADRAAAVACEGAEPAAEMLLVSMGADMQNPDFCFTSENAQDSGLKTVNELNTVEKLVFQTTVESITVPLGTLRIEALREWCASEQCKRLYPYIFYRSMSANGDGDLYKKALGALQHRDIDGGLALMHTAADNMDKRALYFLGEGYLYGKNNLPVNMDFGIKCLMNGACEGDDNAQFLLAVCYAKGIQGYIKQDDNRAILFARCAAGLNNASAVNLLKSYFKIDPGAAANDDRVWKNVLADISTDNCQYAVNQNAPADGLNSECFKDFDTLSKYLLISRFDTVYAAEIYSDETGISNAAALTTSGVYFRSEDAPPSYAAWKSLLTNNTVQEKNGYVWLLYGKKPVCRTRGQELDKSMIYLINKFLKGRK